MSIRRPSIGSTQLTVLVALYVLVLANFTFWHKLDTVFAGQPMRLAVVAIVLALLHFVVLLAFSAPYVLKPVFIFVILAAAASGYFTDTFGIVIDREMIRNIAQTTPTEAGHLITPRFIGYFLAAGVLPALLIAWARIAYVPLWRQVRTNTLVIMGCLLVCAGLLASDLSTYIPFWQRNREATMAYLNPFTAVYSTVHYGILQFRDMNIVARPYGVDARQGPLLAAAKKKMLTVIVVGETARAQDFSLDGYARDTNPELEAASNVVSMTKTTSCGTATAVSMPCMFSHLGHDNFSNRAALSSENLLDVLNHAGIQVAWWENNTGPKNISDRVPTFLFSENPVAKYCDKGECLDQVLVDRLRAHLKDFTGNAVIVLHTTGSHGPAYYQRYPDAFRKFRPDCRNAELSQCSSTELVNAYDNTILYTDHILAEVIDTLKEHGGEFASSMIYMSDHGESLGENGLYLHGAPYAFAPTTQTHIPFITWISDDFASATGLDMACVSAEKDKPFTHDNLFDTVLGLMDIETKVYAKKRDAFAPCRTKDLAATAE